MYGHYGEIYFQTNTTHIRLCNTDTMIEIPYLDFRQELYMSQTCFKNILVLLDRC